MRKLFYFLLCLAAVTAWSCSKDDDDNDAADEGTKDGVTLYKKYEVKSGIIKFNSYVLFSSSTWNDTSSYIVYFDEYGAKEVNYNYDNEGKLTDISMVKGDGWHYSIDLEEKTGIKTKSSLATGTEMQFSLEFSDNYKSEHNFQIKNDTSVCGKTCQMYTFNSTESTLAITAGYKGIVLYYNVKTSSMDIIDDAYSFEENVAIPASVWEIPADVKITESEYSIK